MFSLRPGLRYNLTAVWGTMASSEACIYLIFQLLGQIYIEAILDVASKVARLYNNVITKLNWKIANEGKIRNLIAPVKRLVSFVL